MFLVSDKGVKRMEIIHTSVLLNETLEWLSPENESFADNAFMVDSTLGEGGHSFAFLNHFVIILTSCYVSRETIYACIKSFT